MDGLTLTVVCALYPRTRRAFATSCTVIGCVWPNVPPRKAGRPPLLEFAASKIVIAI